MKYVAAADYLKVLRENEELREQVRYMASAHNQRFISRVLHSPLLAVERQRAIPPLTATETGLVRWLAQRHDMGAKWILSAELASELGVSLQVVRNFVCRVRGKMRAAHGWVDVIESRSRGGRALHGYRLKASFHDWLRRGDEIAWENQMVNPSAIPETNLGRIMAFLASGPKTTLQIAAALDMDPYVVGAQMRAAIRSRRVARGEYVVEKNRNGRPTMTATWRIPDGPTQGEVGKT